MSRAVEALPLPFRPENWHSRKHWLSLQSAENQPNQSEINASIDQYAKMLLPSKSITLPIRISRLTG